MEGPAVPRATAKSLRNSP